MRYLRSETALTRFTPASPQHSASGKSPKPTTTSRPLVILAPVHELGPATTFSDTPVVLPIFENNDRMINGLSVLFQHRHLSPLLVERKAVTAEVRNVQHTERVRGNLLLIDPLDVWRCDLSYVVTRTLDIMVMVHIPVAKASSYRQLYQYVRTPLAFDKGLMDFFPNPPESHLLLDKNSNPRVLREEDLSKCKKVRSEDRFCPGLLYVLNSLPPTCLTH